MLPILSAEQIRALDAYTIANEPVTSIALMERACQAFVKWFVSNFDKGQTVGVVCGTGNNGGDGLGIARLLAAKKYKVKVWIVRGGARESTDFAKNLKRLPKTIGRTNITQSPEPTMFRGCDILIDAIFGTGLSRPVEGLYKEVIVAMNNAETIRVAVDMPSGMPADAVSAGEIFRAHHTVTFQFPRMSFLLPTHGSKAGRWSVADIGLMREGTPATEAFFVELQDVKALVHIRDKFSHKGDYGKVLIIAGSFGKMGAAVLAARACLRNGAGLLTVHVPSKGYDIIQISVPEAMTTVDPSTEMFTRAPKLSPFDVIGIGPGIGTSPDTVNAFRQVLEHGKPMVIDADALNILALERSLLQVVPRGSILTPHPGEFERLVGKAKDDFERLNQLRRLAIELQSVVVLKGAHTCIAGPDGKLYFNSTGNPGMATGGSGDVLTGILTAQLGVNKNALDAAIVGVYLHGLAGDLGSEVLTETALAAGDIVQFLPEAWTLVERS